MPCILRDLYYPAACLVRPLSVVIEIRSSIRCFYAFTALKSIERISTLPERSFPRLPAFIWHLHIWHSAPPVPSDCVVLGWINLSYHILVIIRDPLSHKYWRMYIYVRCTACFYSLYPSLSFSKNKLKFVYLFIELFPVFIKSQLLLYAS